MFACCIVASTLSAAPVRAATPIPTVPTVATGANAGANATSKSPAFAVIATNNRSLSTKRPDLHYADDDGAKYAALFEDMLGPGKVTLLTDFDAGSRLLFPHWAKRARRPTVANFETAMQETIQRVIGSLRAGQTPDVYVVLAGHGDVRNGSGFIELADGELSADMLERSLSRLKRARVHLLMDSCNSWFMLNPRKPGGTRWATDKAPKLLKKYPNVGALISTSSEGLTYEWSQLQSGIFSYEVRSGLRGAADIDLDGRVTYAELDAFIQTANSKLVNELYRPKVYARGPTNGARRALAAWTPKRSVGRTLQVPTSGTRHLTVRDANGVRLMDAHKEAGTALTLHLPRTGRFSIEERTPPKRPGERPARRILKLDGKRSKVQLDALPLAVAEVQARGSEAPVFDQLFAAPHGRQAYQRYLAANSAQDEPVHYSATLKDVVRLRDHLQTAVALERDGTSTVSLLSLSGGFAGIGLGAVLTVDKNLTGSERSAAMGMAFGAGALMLGSGLTTLITASDSDKLLSQFDAIKTASPKARAEGLATMETRLEALVEQYETVRLINGGIMAGGGAIMLVPGVIGLANGGEDANAASTATSFVAGVGLVALGIYLLTEYKFPIERTWELYLRQRDGEFAESLESADNGVKVTPSVGASGTEPTPTVGVQGSF